jgi:hypothetical protein
LTGDLPDYTRLFTVNISLAENLRVFATKAESVTKKSAKASGNPSCYADLDPPAKGNVTGLLLVIGSTDTAGSWITVQSRQSGLLTTVLDYVRIPANDSKILVFPCWVPTQDLGNGTDSNIRVLVSSTSCPPHVDVFVLYYEETPA